MSEKKKKSTLTKNKKNKKTKKILKNVKPEFYFKLIDGSEIKNLLELADALDRMTDDVFYYHVNEQRNDFSNWVRDVFNEKDLAESIEKLNNKLETEISVLKFLVNKLK
jgi:hypothetical protein